MQGLDFGLKDRNHTSLDFGMDESYTNFLSKKRKRKNIKLKKKIRRLKAEKLDAENKGQDKKVIALSGSIAKAVQQGIKQMPKGSFTPKTKALMKEKNCQEQLATMRLTREGMEEFIKSCEEKGDFSASKIQKKEQVAEALLKNEIVKNERVLDRIDDEIAGNNQAIQERNYTDKRKVLPIIAVGLIVFLIINKF